MKHEQTAEFTIHNKISKSTKFSHEDNYANTKIPWLEIYASRVCKLSSQNEVDSVISSFIAVFDNQSSKRNPLYFEVKLISS